MRWEMLKWGAKDDKAVIKLNRFKKWLNEYAAENGMNEVK
jgi:hypothetical protein